MTTATPIDYDVMAHPIRAEMLEEGFDLPELAKTMQAETSRAAATRYLFALRNVGRELSAHDA